MPGLLAMPRAGGRASVSLRRIDFVLATAAAVLIGGLFAAMPPRTDCDASAVSVHDTQRDCAKARHL